MTRLAQLNHLIISIHALRVEGDRVSPALVREVVAFLSTPSVWRATYGYMDADQAIRNFYPRPPCGGRHIQVSGIIAVLSFLSTPSVWRATELF